MEKAFSVSSKYFNKIGFERTGTRGKNFVPSASVTWCQTSQRQGSPKPLDLAKIHNETSDTLTDSIEKLRIVQSFSWNPHDVQHR